ncbi:MAG: transposase, partial [Clostridiales bacterium]|nr:transposase [Clostridiales bacterium]
IDYAIELIGGLPVPETRSYVLTDSWYTNGKIIDACAERGYHFIEALKTNRIIYPQGIHIGIAEFAAKYIEKPDVDLVTVNGSEYYVYRYEGKLNGVDNAVVLLSWPTTAFKNPKALKAFICTDTTLDTLTILKYYGQRWCIETFFGQSKDTLGFGKYQIRSIKGIERLWTIMSLCHLLCTRGLGSNMSFGDGVRLLRKDILRGRISFIYQHAQNGTPIEILYDLCS